MRPAIEECSPLNADFHAQARRGETIRTIRVNVHKRIAVHRGQILYKCLLQVTARCASWQLPRADPWASRRPQRAAAPQRLRARK